MKGWLKISAFAAAGLLTSGLLMAQAPPPGTDEPQQNNDDERASDHGAFALGGGLVNAASQTETYLMASLRLRIGGHREKDPDDWRGRAPSTGIRGYIEPEVGYWKASADQGGGKDELFGFNIIGVVPLGPVDSFFGAGAAYHRIDQSILQGVAGATGSASKLGIDTQFGIDIHLGHTVSLFGAGRIDLVQDLRRSVEEKAYLGLRFHF